MERLTARDGEFVAWKGRPLYMMGPADIYVMAERLASYEDTGMTPKEIKAPFTEDAMINLAAQALGVESSRLRELAEADKAGRVIVLPAKKGDTWKKAMSILDKKYAEAKKLQFVRDPLAWAMYHTWKEFDDGKRCD